MRFVALTIALALALISVFAWLNWSVLTAASPLSLGVVEFQAPLGLIMLVVMAVVVALFLAYIAIVQGRSIVHGRRHLREVQALREQVDQAEASRLKELRETVAQGLRAIETEQGAAARDTQERIAALEQRLQERIDEATRTLSAYIGEVEDKLDRRLGKEPG
jgi:biopolymer transport protein ExbB/TolQ